MITYFEIKQEIKRATKNIKQANKGFPHPVYICKDFNLFPKENGMTLQIKYRDGELKEQFYNIAM